jgi:hypothetical protein
MNYACALVFPKYGSGSRKSVNGWTEQVHGVYIPLKGGGGRVMLELIIDFAKQRHCSLLQPLCLFGHWSLYLPQFNEVKIKFSLCLIKQRNSSVDIATAGRPSLILGRYKRFFSTPQRPDRVWVQPSLLSNGYRGLFPQRWSGCGVKLTAILHLAPRPRMVELYLHSPIFLYGAVLNWKLIW